MRRMRWSSDGGRNGDFHRNCNFVNPYATVETVHGIEEYMRTYRISDIHELIGAVQ